MAMDRDVRTAKNPSSAFLAWVRDCKNQLRQRDGFGPSGGVPGGRLGPPDRPPPPPGSSPYGASPYGASPYAPGSAGNAPGFGFSPTRLPARLAGGEAWT